jgi:AraC-like DNA-binding protein
MEYRESLPATKLADHIKLFWSLEYDPQGVRESETILPDGCPELVFNLSDRFVRVHDSATELQPVTLFAAQMIRSIKIRPTGKVHLFGVRFHPVGAFILSKFAMNELTGTILTVQDVLGCEGEELEEKVNSAGCFEQRMRVFEAYYLKKLGTPSSHSASNQAVKLIMETKGAISVGALARLTGSTERTLERVFNREVGLGPKLLSRIIRFQCLINSIQNAKTPGNLDALFELGYFDQSHAIRDFREFSGMTPLSYFKRAHRLSDAFVGASGQVR